MRSRSLGLTLVALLFTPLGALCADSAVILGGGHVGSWFTAGSVANPNTSSFNLVAAGFPLTFVGPCPDPCPLRTIALPPLGSNTLEGDVARLGFSSIMTIYLTQEIPPTPMRVIAREAPEHIRETPAVFPIIRPRLVDSFNPTRSVDIPVVLISQLISANLSVLNFSGATRDGPAHSNFVLGNIMRNDSQPAEDLPLSLELFDSAGNRVGSASLTLGYGETALIGDIVSALGVTHVPVGMLRVTRTGGGALMWGILYSVDANGAVTASVGTDLSP